MPTVTRQRIIYVILFISFAGLLIVKQRKLERYVCPHVDQISVQKQFEVPNPATNYPYGKRSSTDIFTEHWWKILTLTALKYFYINQETKGFFQFEIIIKCLAGSSFRFIWIPMLRVYGHSKYVYSYSAGSDFRRQNLTSKFDPRVVMVNNTTRYTTSSD